MRGCAGVSAVHPCEVSRTETNGSLSHSLKALMQEKLFLACGRGVHGVWRAGMVATVLVVK